MIALLVAVAGTLGTQPPVTAIFCRNATTIELDACLAAEVAKATTVLDRYRAAARARITADTATSPSVLPAFDAADAQWRRFAEAKCRAVYTLWEGGSIRGAIAATCQIRLARLHTHELWGEWLTYMDTTPPILPEPIVKTGL